MKNHTAVIVKPSIELEAWSNFCQKFAAGSFAGQRFGQAFYNEFKLHKVTDQLSLNNIYSKDGVHAMNSIKAMFEFT